MTYWPYMTLIYIFPEISKKPASTGGAMIYLVRFYWNIYLLQFLGGKKSICIDPQGICMRCVLKAFNILSYTLCVIESVSMVFLEDIFWSANSFFLIFKILQTIPQHVLVIEYSWTVNI